MFISAAPPFLSLTTQYLQLQHDFEFRVIYVLQDIAGTVHQQLVDMPKPAGVSEEQWEKIKPSKLTVRTIGMQDFTIRALFDRCSGDWEQIKDGPELKPPAAPFPTRAWFSTLVNVDEAYSLLSQLGLLACDQRGGPSKEMSPSEHASTLNTLLGTGRYRWCSNDTLSSSNLYRGT